MSITNGPNIGVMANGSLGEAHYDQFMAFLRAMDLFGMPNVQSYLTNTPPGSPSDGDAHIIGAAPTGAWAGKAGNVARYSTVMAAWAFFIPKNGWMIQANSVREIYRYTAGAWEIYYQEGTWTPSLVGANVAGTQTYSVQGGRFTKSGRLYSIEARIITTAIDPATNGAISLAGLPATVYAPSGTTACAAIGRYAGITMAGGRTQLTANYLNATTTVYLKANGSALATVDINHTDLSAAVDIMFSGSYIA